jgi:hypothetical protein
MKEIDSKVRLIDLEKVETSEIRAILSDYYIDSELDAGGDVLIERSDKIYIKVDPLFKMLRFFCYMEFKGDMGNPVLLEEIDNVNSASSSVKFSTLSNSLMAEYGIPLFGFIDHKLLLKVIDHFDEELKTFKIVLHDFLGE